MNQKSVALTEKLAILLSSLVSAKFTAHGYHWNVKGRDFKEFHDFFGEIYSDYDEAIDPTSENIRKLGFDAPYLLGDFQEMTRVNEERVQTGSVDEMLSSLIRVNQILLELSLEAFAVANTCNEQGIANFLAERIDKHEFWNWQLTSSLPI
jgi:starvation-inducible DNA-binding protein